MKLFFSSILLLCAFQLLAAPAEARQPSRVQTARNEKDAVVREYFKNAGVAYPPKEVFFRAFKEEPGTDSGLVELWAKDDKANKFAIIKKYKVCAASGQLGPKRKQGDYQVPEGFYTLDLFNPWSSYFLSIRISYPNASDRILGAKGNLGGDIYIHGNCASIGCLSMTDNFIKEIYIIAEDAKKAGGAPIHFHIFPRRMTEENIRELAALAGPDKKLAAFWTGLAEGYRIFEETRLPPVVTVDNKGQYKYSRRGGGSGG